MIERLRDFNDKQFGVNEWGCKCIVNEEEDIYSVTFFKEDMMVHLHGNEAKDMLDWVLSYYYEKDGRDLQSCFNAWIVGNPDVFKDNENKEDKEEYPKLTPPEVPIECLYRNLLKAYKRSLKEVSEKDKEIEEWKNKAEKYSADYYELRQQIKRYDVKDKNGENLHDIIVELNKTVSKRNARIEQLEKEVEQLKDEMCENRVYINDLAKKHDTIVKVNQLYSY